VESLLLVLQTPDVKQAAAFPVFAPHSVYAHSIAGLSKGVLWACLGILLIVAGLVSYCVRKFRERPGAPPPRLIYGNPKLEIGYTVTR